ncbi:DUF927 domain-containing protein [Bradyrhizobium sp. Pear77]|uniref:DUF927 domain-containing protein n=1 Tax=Bradyrhizobium altum TaxID=1571202 RepID=UPI0028A23DF1|nr:DUF927 domain-containing protein [Bradyrhizobium altum]MCC8953137.1 DUF927 domain-containing protein [Bradyrhizobium altum]
MSSSDNPSYNYTHHGIKMSRFTQKVVSSVDSTTAGVALRIVATTTNQDTDQSFLEVEYLTLDGSRKRRLIAREYFRTPTKVADQLLKAGARLSNPVPEVKAALASSNGVPHYTTTGRTGWHQDSFVLPTETIGPLAGKLRFDGSLAPDPALGMRAGTLKKWRRGLRAPYSKSDYLVLGTSLAAASTILGLIGETEGAIFHLHGLSHSPSNGVTKENSSSGKTTVGRVTMSAIGRADKNDLMTFDLTGRGAEELCFAHNHLTMGLDEEGRAHGHSSSSRISAFHLPYMVAGGRGAFRSAKAAADPALRNLTWALFAISTGERPLDGRAVARPEGQQVRQIALPVPSGAEGGIFNLIDGCGDEVLLTARALAAQTEETIASNYGMALGAFVSKLCSEPREEVTARINKSLAAFVRKVEAGEPWEQRFARKFAIVYAAAALMAKFGIAPWKRGRAWTALVNLHRIARSALLNHQVLTDAVVSKLRKAVREGEFPVVKKGASIEANDSLGMTRKLNRKSCLLIRKSRIQSLVRPQTGTEMVLQELTKRGILLKGSDGKRTALIMINGKRKRYLCLDKNCLMH